ncbi:unnamed protein product, partial [Heterotrigona itama]
LIYPQPFPKIPNEHTLRKSFSENENGIPNLTKLEKHLYVQNKDTLFDDNNKLKTIINNQMALIRKVINTDGIKQIEKIISDVNYMKQHIEHGQLLTKLLIRGETVIYDIHFQLDELLNTKTRFIKNYAQTLGHRILNTVIESKAENFQFILDIADLSIFIISNKLFFKISVLIILDKEWDIVTTCQHQIFLVSEMVYINTDNEYITTHCKKSRGTTLRRQTMYSLAML